MNSMKKSGKGKSVFNEAAMMPVMADNPMTKSVRARREANKQKRINEIDHAAKSQRILESIKVHASG